MTALLVSEREGLLLNAALNRDPALAVASWQAWTAQIALEDAPRPELRLLTAVHGNLTQIAPQLEPAPQTSRKSQGQLCQNESAGPGNASANRGTWPAFAGHAHQRHGDLHQVRRLVFAVFVRRGLPCSDGGVGQGLSGARRSRLDARFRHHAVIASAPKPHASGQLELSQGAGRDRSPLAASRYSV